MRKLPTGQERGKFLALDLGGTNFRVLALELTEEKEFLMDSKIYAIPQNIMTGNNLLHGSICYYVTIIVNQCL